MVRWFLLETRIGDRLLALWERVTGLVMVSAEDFDLVRNAVVKATAKD